MDFIKNTSFTESVKPSFLLKLCFTEFKFTEFEFSKHTYRHFFEFLPICAVLSMTGKMHS